MKDNYNEFDDLSKNTSDQSGKSSFEEFMSNYKPKLDLEPEDGFGSSEGIAFFNSSEKTDEATAQPTSEIPRERSDIDSYLTRQIDAEEMAAQSTPEEIAIQMKIKEAVTAMKLNNNPEVKPKKTRKKRKGRISGPLFGGLYLIFVFGISAILAVYVVIGALDLTGLGQSDDTVSLSFTAEQAVDVDVLANILKENGIIKRPELFKIYAKRGDKYKKFVAQNNSEFSASMGYESILNTMMTRPRESISVTFPEGITAEKVAALLEKNNICSRQDFLDALNLEYPIYSFLNEMPQTGRYKNRAYRLEGFLFPDTYEFYLESKATTVVTTFLDNFNAQVSTSLRAEMKTKGMNLYDVLIQASLVEWEAGNETDMPRVARVLTNRLASSDLKKLQCDSTYRYLREVRALRGDNFIKSEDYDTYAIEGLMASPINNPGIKAIKAVISPSTEKKYVDCFYFVTNIHDDAKPTYFSKTYAEHDALCKKYKIGVHAEK